MGITVATTRDVSAVGGGNQDLSTADVGGLTPGAMLLFGVGATADGTAHDDLNIMMGAATGSSERWTMCTFSEHGQTTTDANRRGATDECAMFIDGAAAVDGEADFVQFIANGARINWGNAPASAWFLTPTFFAGTDLSAYAGTFTLGNQDVEVNVNTVGFPPDMVIFGSIARSFNDSSGIHMHFSVGAAANLTGTPQYCYEFRSGDGLAASAVSGRISDDYAVMQIDSAGAMDWGCEIGSFDAQGFSAWARGGNSGDDIGFLALAFNGAAQFTVGSITAPVANGNQSINDPGFTPWWVLVGLTMLSAFDTAYTNADAGAFGISAFDADNEYCNAVADEDNQATTDTQSLSDNQVLNFPQDSGAAGYAGTFVSFDDMGWTWNITAQRGTAHRWWYAAIGEVAAAPVSYYYAGPEPEVTASMRYRTAWKSQDD